MYSTDGVQIGVLLKVILGVLQFARRLRGNYIANFSTRTFAVLCTGNQSCVIVVVLE